ncbi:MAG TPA: DUF4870 domain-containing protein [Candidatus Acidoferrales bacterium]|jgi:uncharacterized membrane protein|nr:DUF4870 domain-containing protein [Candidatus Acidoferrales bacterium]
MPHCTKCGAAVADNAGFCPACGATQGAAPVTTSPAVSSQTGMSENVAGLLCYLLGWITGLIFYLIDKRPFVRFHAAQSIVVFGGLNILSYVLGMFLGVSAMSHAWTGVGTGVILLHLLNLLTFILWIFLMVKAYQGQKFRVPIAADLAEQIFGKS